MSKMKPLHSLAKRDLLAARKFDPETVREYADDFLAQERYDDALLLFSKIADKPGITKVKEAAINLGNPDLLWQVERQDRQTVTRNDWVACGDSAMRLSKFRSAAYVFERIGDTEKLAAAEKEFKPVSEAPSEELEAE